MISFMNYNFCLDGNCVDPVPTNVENITTTTVYNGVYNHFNLESDIMSEYNSNVPTRWEDTTILNATFNGNVNAGDFDSAFAGVTSLLIKRRKVGEFNWVTIRRVRINSLNDLSFALNDYLVTPGKYEYAFVPVLNESVEGNYIIETIDVNFNGVFVCDIDSIYKLYTNVQYTGTTQTQKVATFEPFGRKYPVYITNATTNYQKGRLNATVLNSDYLQTRKLDRNALRMNRDAFVQFLTNNKAKIIKDWNGNAWMIAVVDDVDITFNDRTDNALADVGFNYVEVGEIDNQQDMEDNGLVGEI